MEQDVKAYIITNSESFYAELFALGDTREYEYNHYHRGRHATKFAEIEFNVSALDLPTRMGCENHKSTLGSYLKYKDITHIDIIADDEKSYCISVPWRTFNRYYDVYNFYQRETVEGNTVTITFEKKNLWKNLPKGIWMYIRRFFIMRILRG